MRSSSSSATSVTCLMENRSLKSAGYIDLPRDTTSVRSTNTLGAMRWRRDLLLSNRRTFILLLVSNMSPKSDVWQGTLAFMVLQTLDALGPQHGYGVARRIEQTSDHTLSINHGSLYPVLLKLEQEGAIAAEWGVSENNRRARFYRITKAGQKQLTSEVNQWTQATEIVGRFLALKGVKT